MVLLRKVVNAQDTQDGRVRVGVGFAIRYGLSSSWWLCLSAVCPGHRWIELLGTSTPQTFQLKHIYPFAPTSIDVPLVELTLLFIIIHFVVVPKKVIIARIPARVSI